MADRFKSIAKGGWHPGKDEYGGRKESWRKDFKGVDQIVNFGPLRI